MKENVRIKRLFLVTLMMVIACAGLYVDTVFATNTSISSAAQVDFGKTYSDTMTDDIYERTYKIVLPSSGKITLQLEGNNDDLKLYLYDSEQTQLKKIIADKNSVTNKVTMDATYYLTSGTYYFTLNSYVGGIWGVSTGDYQFKIDFESANESFNETNDNENKASHLINLGKKYIGQIAENDTEDNYCFNLPSSGRASISIEGENKSLSLELCDSEGKRMKLSSESKNTVTNKLVLNREFDLTSGTYYIVIDGYIGGGIPHSVGNYQLEVKFSSANESFMETHKDDYLTGANLVAFDTTYRGQIAYNNDDTDYYIFKVKKKDTIEIMMSADEGGTAYIYSPQGESLWSRSISYDSQTGKCTLSRFIEISPGTYYFRVKSSNTGNYSFKISSYNETKKPARVTLSSLKSTKKKRATIKWKKISDVSGYQIQYAKSKKFKGKKTLTVGGSIINKTINKLSSKKKYYVRIRAYKIVAGKNKYGSWSKVKTVKIK